MGWGEGRTPGLWASATGSTCASLPQHGAIATRVGLWARRGLWMVQRARPWTMGRGPGLWARLGLDAGGHCGLVLGAATARCYHSAPRCVP